MQAILGLHPGQPSVQRPFSKQENLVTGGQAPHTSEVAPQFGFGIIGWQDN